MILILAISGSVAAEKTEDSFTWDKIELVIITATSNRVDGFDEFVEEVKKVLLNIANWQSRSILDITKDKSHLELLKDNHTIFTIRPENIEELEKLEANHPDLLPITCSKLKSYSFPLLYFSRDNKGKIRGVIITNEVTPLLATLLTKDALPLDIAFWHEDEQLKDIVVGRGITPSVSSISPFVFFASLETVILESPLSMIYVSKGEKVRTNWEEFGEEMRRFLEVSIHGRPSPVPMGKSLKWLTRNTIYFIHPKNLKCLQDLKAEYPQLLPLSCNELGSELESYSSPLFYFSRDIKADKIRGIIVARRVDLPLAEMLSKDIPLDISFRYENGQLQILE
jgi:hypothetical protein